jgi:dihydrolipoamide dehydrogenase
MPGQPYDLVIIGGGPGGYIGAIRAAQLGLRTALVEREKVGGTCLHIGCIPTKAMLHTAETLEHLRDAADLGITLTGAPAIDLAAVHKRKARVVETLYKGTLYLMRKNKIDVFTGTGRFLSARKIGVALADGSETELEASAVIIATGSAPRSVPGVTIDHKRIIDSTGALELQSIPESIAILGAGPVGVEFASVYRAFGSDVTVIELLPTLVPLEDEEVGKALEKSFARRGIRSVTGATAKSATPSGDRVKITVAKGDETEALEADYLLVAVGRAPATQELTLAEAGVQVDRGAVVVNEHLETTAPGIYAIGDVITGQKPYRLAHVASDEAIAVVERIAGVEAHPVNYDAVPRPTFSIPQVATVGLTERQAQEQGYSVKVGRFSFQPNSKAVIDGTREGFVKVVTEAKIGEILGIHMIGASVTELLAEGIAAKFLEATVTELAAAVHSHPTLSEALKEAALDAMGRAINI